MRRALLPVILPAALLLAGCSVFQGGSGQPAADGWEQHDGYSLQCKNVERVECLRFADDLAARHRAESDAPFAKRCRSELPPKNATSSICSLA